MLNPDFFFRCISLSQRHPPLVMMVTAPFYFLFGKTQDMGVMINAAVFLGVLIFATYKIGKRISDAKTGLFAAFILTMYPVLFNQLKVYMLDLPLAAVVSLSIYFLIRSDSFRNLKYTLLLLISSISGMLIKPNFLFFLALPLAYMLMRRLFKPKGRSFLTVSQQESAVNFSPANMFSRIFILVTLAGLTILCLSYYFSSQVFIANVGRGSFITKALIVLERLLQGPGYLQTWPSVAPEGVILRRIHALFWYIWGFINWQVSFFFFVVFFMAVYFFRKYKVFHKDILLIWFIGSYFLVSSAAYGIGINMEVSAVRYTMPLLPAVALISAIGIMKIPFRKFRCFLVTVVVIFGFFQFMCVSYPLGIKLKKLEVPVKLEDKYDFFPSSIVLFDPGAWAVSGGDSGSHPRDFKEEAAVCEEILRIIDESNNKMRINITVIPDDTRLWYLQYLAFIKDKSFNIFCDWNYFASLVSIALEKKQNIKYRKLISDADYIIDKEGGWQGEPSTREIVENNRRYFNLYKYKFFLIGMLRWPDGAKILIYKKKRE